MRMKHLLSSVFVVFFLSGGSVFGSDLSKFLDGLFQNINGRPPSGSELNYYSTLTRNVGPLENAIAIYGSDTYFINQAHRDANLFVSQLYQAFLGRSPRFDERQFWVAQFQRPGVRRTDLIRQFCRTNHITQLPSFLPTPPSFSTPGNPLAIAAQLSQQVSLLINIMNAELGHTYFGNAVIQDAQKLSTVATQYQQLVQDRRSTPEQASIAISNLDQALANLERRYYRVPGSSPQSKTVLHQVSQLVAATRNANNGWVQQPIAPLPPIAGPGFPAAGPGIPDVSRMVAESRRFSYGLLSYRNNSPLYASLSRDVQGLSTQIEGLSVMIRQGQRRPALRQTMLRIVEQTRRISRNIRGADMRIQRGWMNLQSEITTVANSLGANSSFNVQPSRPVIINRPAWPNFPYQPSPAYSPNHNQEAITLTDQLIGKIDGYIQSLMPLMATNGNANAVIRSLQDFKHFVLVFRQSAASGTFTTSLARSADNLMTQYQRVSREVTQLVSRDAALNSPLFYQIGELVQKIRYAARGTRP